jgi:hypothetical protein
VALQALNLDVHVIGISLQLAGLWKKTIREARRRSYCGSGRRCQSTSRLWVSSQGDQEL